MACHERESDVLSQVPTSIQLKKGRHIVLTMHYVLGSWITNQRCMRMCDTQARVVNECGSTKQHDSTMHITIVTSTFVDFPLPLRALSVLLSPDIVVLFCTTKIHRLIVGNLNDFPTRNCVMSSRRSHIDNGKSKL